MVTGLPEALKALQHDLDRSMLTGDLQIDLIIPLSGSTPESVRPEGQCSKARVGKGSHQAPQCLRSDVVQYCWRQEMQGDKSYERLPPATFTSIFRLGIRVSVHLARGMHFRALVED